MKQPVLVAVLAGALAVAAEAQQTGKAVAVDAGGAAPSTNYVWVACNGGSTVSIRRTDGSAVTTLAAGFGFNQPYDIVASPANHLVYVSNAGAVPTGTVTVINADTLQLVQVVVIAGSTNLHGMSMSEDESAVFIAGQDAAGPAVFRMSTTAPFASARVGGLAVAGGAEDCVVIKSSITGGGGNDPGRVYFSVPRGGAAGLIGIINLNPASPAAPIQTGVGALASIEQAGSMERTPDHRFVFVGCSKILSFGADVRIVRIDAASGAATAPVVNNGIQDLANNRSWDVSFTTDAGGGNRGFVLIQQDSGTKQIREILDTGLPSGVPLVSANPALMTDPITLRFTPASTQLLVGDINGTNQGYARFDASTTPISGGADVGAVGNRCQAFAVIGTPAVVVTDICPRASLQTGPLTVTVHGAGFNALTSVDYGFGTAPVGAGLIDSNTFVFTLAGALSGPPVGLVVTNPQNLQTGQIDGFHKIYNPEFRAPFTIALPSVSQGYRMMSMPQYATLTALKSALTAALGPYNPVLYRVFFHRGGRYVELNGLADDGCDLAGESFWVLTRNGASFTMSEPDVRRNDNGDNRVIPLNPGFNMVAVPQTDVAGTGGQIPWASVHVTTNPADFSVGGTNPVMSAAGLLIVDPAVEYVNGGYFLANTLLSGQGVWVQNISGKPAYLVFQPALVTKPAAPSYSSGIPPAAGSMPPGPPSGITNGDSRSSGCGLLGLEWLLPVLFLRRRLRRRLPA